MSEESGAQQPPQDQPLAEKPKPGREAEKPQQLDPEVVPPENPEDEATRMIYLPGLLADNFGLSQEDARNQVMLGRVAIDGEELPPRTVLISHEKIAGKTVNVATETREFTFEHPANV